MTPFLTAILIAATVQAETPVKGRLCIAEPKAMLTAGNCTDVAGKKLEIEAADRERLFLWSSADGAAAQLGAVPAKTAAIDLEADGQSQIKLTIRGDETRGWPADVRFIVIGKEEWRSVLPARTAARLQQVTVPSGTYAIHLGAERHRPFSRARIDASKAVALGELRLLPLPIVRGKVIGIDDKPVAGAVVSFADKVCTTANEQGEFACELRPVRDEAIVVSQSGYASREIGLNRDTGDVDLGVIRLATGQSLTVQLQRTEPIEDLKLTLYYESPTKYEHTRLRTKTIAPSEEEVRFDDLGPGKYHLVFEGKQPLEKLAVTTTIEEGKEAVQQVEIDPFQVEGAIFFGDEPLRDAKLEIGGPDHTWRRTVAVNAEGKFAGTMWQKDGRVIAFLSSPAFGSSELIEAPDLGDDPSIWEIRIARRMLLGRVVDADTKQPVAKPNIHMVAEREDRGGTLHTTVPVNAEGQFQILAHRPGTYHLQVSAPDYVASIIDVKISAADATRNLEIGLERGIVQVLEIVSPSGAPMSNALVLEGIQKNRNNPEFFWNADASGRLNLRGMPGEMRLLYVVPREGSFAVVRLQIPYSSNNAKPRQIIVPPAVGTLRVLTEDADGKPVRAGILIRHNGEFLPGAIRSRVTRNLILPRVGEILLPRFPAGTYEVWALSSEEDEVALIASNGALREPARVGLSAGEASVTVQKRDGRR
jgi:hypothetical protein